MLTNNVPDTYFLFRHPFLSFYARTAKLFEHFSNIVTENGTGTTCTVLDKVLVGKDVEIYQFKI
jgi:hypothetical protein